MCHAILHELPEPKSEQFLLVNFQHGKSDFRGESSDNLPSTSVNSQIELVNCIQTLLSISHAWIIWLFGHVAFQSLLQIWRIWEMG